MLMVKTASISKEDVIETLLSPATPEMEAEEEPLWQEEFDANRDFYMALADEASEESKQGMKQTEVFAGTGKFTDRSKTSWLNTVGIYPEESSLNRMLDAGAKIREAENAEQC